MTDLSPAWPEAPETGNGPRGPLHGVRVLDLTVFAAGPYAVTQLSQLGADVIRIDPPNGDPIRMVTPNKSGQPTTYNSCNLGKRSVIADLKDDAQREMVFRLASAADVLVENSRAGTMERLGLGYEALRVANPRLVYCSSSSYGRVGPLSHLGITDTQGQAFSGFSTLNGVPGRGPEQFRYVAMIDMATGLYLCQSALIGLYQRHRTGRGQRIETSQLEASIAIQLTRVAEYLADGIMPTGMGSGTATLVPSRSYRCRDGEYVSVTAATDDAWRELCRAIGRTDLADDAGFASNASRVGRREEVDAILAEALGQKAARWWCATLPERGVPCVRVRSLEDDIEDGGMLFSNGLVHRVPLSGDDTLAVGAPVWTFEKNGIRLGPPHVPGQHTAEVMDELRALSGERPDPARHVSGDEQPETAQAGGLPLAGLRILDVTQSIAGPYCSQLLQMLGAEIRRIELPAGDWFREVGPPWTGGMGAGAYQLNRGKGSVAFDWKAPEGIERLRQMLAESDVFLHDLTVTEAGALGLGPEALREVNPDLVDCSVTAMGEDGAWAGMPATELELQSMAGLTRYLGTPGEPPVRVGADIAGTLAGCSASQAVLAALLARDAEGGQHVAVSQLGTLVSATGVMISAIDKPDEWAGIHCEAGTNPSDYGIETADGRLCYSLPTMRTEEAWQEFCAELGAEDVVNDPRFATRALRVGSQPAIRRALEPYFRRRTSRDLLVHIEHSGAMAVEFQDYGALIRHPQIAALGVFAEAEGAFTMAPPWTSSTMDFRTVTAAAAAVGEHTIVTRGEAD